jgi:hypothetical protein
MDVNGKWVGYGLGDVDATVEELKVFLAGKFSYAAALKTSIDAGGTAAQTYDQTMVDVVTQMQTAYGDNSKVNADLVINGIMNEGWQVRCGYIAAPKVVIFTAQGTGVDMWDAGWPQPYAIALAIQAAIPNKVTVQPIGNYPASVTGPAMGVSAEMGRTELKRLMGVGSGPGPVYASGPCAAIFYSQSAIFGSHWWREDVLPADGDLANRKDDVLFVITEGNPLRAPDTAYGNDDAGWGPSPTKDGVTTGGIAGPDCLTVEQTTEGIFYDYVWLGNNNGQTELYTANPGGLNPWTAEAPAGKVGTLIYNAVVDQDPGAIIEVVDALATPIGMVEEIYNGITFAVAGPNADHFDYDITPMVALGVRKINAWNTAYVLSGGAITAASAAA